MFESRMISKGDLRALASGAYRDAAEDGPVEAPKQLHELQRVEQDHLIRFAQALLLRSGAKVEATAEEALSPIDLDRVIPLLTHQDVVAIFGRWNLGYTGAEKLQPIDIRASADTFFKVAREIGL